MSFQSADITKAAPKFGHWRSLLARAATLCVLLLLGAWSGHAQATTGCYLQHTSTQFQQGAPGSTYNHSFTIVDDGGGCSGTISGTVSITGNTTGGGSINNGGGPVTTFNWSGTGGSNFSFTSTTGPLPGGDLSIQSDCLVGCFGGSTFLTYFDESDDLYDFHATTPTTIVTTDLSAVTIGAKSLYNGNPATETVSFYNVTGAPVLLGTDTPDVNGEVTQTYFNSTPGTYALRAQVNCIIITATSTTCPPPDIDYSVTVEATSLSANDLTLETLPSTPLTLSVNYRSASLPAPDGSYVYWNVSSSPPGGDGSVDSSNSQSSGGVAEMDFSASVPGEYQVQASTNCFSCFAPSLVTFTVTVINRTITIVSGDGQSGATNQTLDDPLVIQAQNNSVPTPGVGITWAVMSGSATLSPTGATTDGAGNAFVTVTMGSTAGPVVVRATRNDDTAKFVEFNLNSTLTRNLSIVSGNNQSAATGQTLPSPLIVRATDNNTSASGVTINWSVTSGSASLSSPSSVTNAGGTASTQVTLGGTAGPVVVRATRADDTSEYVDFNLSATLTRQLVIVSGNAQDGAPNAPLASPFVVEARNNNVAAPSTGVTWSIVTGSGSLSDTSTTTDSNGHADSTLTLGASGSVTVKAARSDDSSVYVLFTADTQKLADLPGMSPTQRAIAEAIDSFCPELGGGTSGGGGGPPSTDGPPSTSGFAAATATVDPSSGQYDLWQQCQQLISAAGSDPQGVLDALNELYANIALVQSEAGLVAARAQFDNIKVRIAALRSGTQRTSFGGLAFTNGSGNLPIGSLLQSLAEGDANPDSGSQAGFSRWGFFAAGSIGRVNTDPGDVTPGYDSDITGLTVGVDYRKSDSLIFGGTIGYTKQTDDLLGREGELDTKGWSVSLFGTWYKADSWYTDAVLSWGSNSYEAERWIRYTLTQPGGGTTVVDQHARSDSDGDTLTFAATVGRDFNKNGWGFGPYLRMLYTRLEFDEMVEQTNSGPGSGLALVVDARKLTSFSGVLGGKLTYAHSTDWGVLIPHVQFEWQHEFKDDPSAVTAHFLFDPSETPFTVTGDRLDTDYFRLGFGMSFVLTKGRSGFFLFERSFNQDRITQDRLALGMRFEF